MKEEKLYSMEEVMNYKPTIWEKIKWPTKRVALQIVDFFRYEIKHFVQRGARGYDDTYWFGLDYKLVEIILPNLRKLRANSHGYPAGLTAKGWEKILDRLIAGWEAAERILNDTYLDTVQPNYFENKESITKESLRKVAKLIKADRRKFEMMMPLFTKFFFNLWD